MDKAAFWRGARDSLPFLIIVIPYAMLFGVVARDAGLDMGQVMAMSVLVIAGASQFTALALLQDHAPLWVALGAALFVNLRMAIYSAALVPHLGDQRLGMRALLSYMMVDQAFALAVQTYEANPGMRPAQKLGYYLGAMLLLCPCWYGFTAVGALAGRALPAGLSLDFAVPVCFIALVAPLLRGLPQLVCAGVSVVMSVLLAGLPWSLGLIGAALVAMAAGAQTELWLGRRGARADG